MAKEKKTAAPKSVELLVAHALTLAATKPGAKWMGKGPAALFNEKETNTPAAVDVCLDPKRPLLKKTDAGGTPTLAGFEQVAGDLDDGEVAGVFDQLVGDLTDDQVGPLAKVVATRIPLGERAAFIQKAIGRRPFAASELTPLLAEVVAATKMESEARAAAAVMRKQAHDAAMKALDRAKELLGEMLQNERDAIRRQWEALGGELDALPEVAPRQRDGGTGTTSVAPDARTDEEKDFRRYEADRLAAAWRDAWDAKKLEGRDYLEAAMWNIRGLRLIGEEGGKAPFDGRLHESDAPVSSGAAVRVVRPGWLLQVDDEDYVALKAAVQQA